MRFIGPAAISSGVNDKDMYLLAGRCGTLSELQGIRAAKCSYGRPVAGSG